MAVQDFRLFNTVSWQYTSDVGTFFKFLATSITDIEKNYKERQWKARKYFRDILKNVRTAVMTLLERVIDPTYHSEKMDRHGFGNYKPPAILNRLQRLYGQKILGDLGTLFLNLNDPMYRKQPVEVMPWEIKEVHILLLAHTKSGQELADTNLISYAFIKSNKTGVIYTKAPESWNEKELTNRKTWATLRHHMIAEFENLIASGAGPTLGQ